MWDGPHQLTCKSYCIRSIPVFMILRIAGQSSSLAESAGASNSTSLLRRGLRVQQECSASSGAALLSSVTCRVPCRTAWPRFSSTLSLRLASSSSKCRRHHTGCLQPLDLLHIRQSRRRGWAYGWSYSACWLKHRWEETSWLPCRQAGQPKRLPPPQARRREQLQRDKVQHLSQNGFFALLCSGARGAGFSLSLSLSLGLCGLTSMTP